MTGSRPTSFPRPRTAPKSTSTCWSSPGREAPSAPRGSASCPWTEEPPRPPRRSRTRWAFLWTRSRPPRSGCCGGGERGANDERLLHRQRPAGRPRKPSHGAPSGRAAGTAGADRDQGGVRRGRVRRLHRPPGWRARPLLSRAAPPVRGPAGRDHREPGRGAGTELPRAVRGLRRRPVRGLHARGRRHLLGAPPGKPVPDPRRGPRGPGRQPLPVHRVRGNPPRPLPGARAMSLAVRPRSLEEAVRFLGEDPGLVPAAGCTDLMVRGPLELHRLDRVMDLLGIPELRGIREVEGGIEIGATTPFSEIRRSAAVRAAFPALTEAAALVGGW